MKAFEDYNPIAVFICLVATAVIPMFSMNPILLMASLLCACAFWFIRNKGKKMKTHLLLLCVFAVVTIINPLFSHNGRTVLFVLNNNPVTFEALCFGATMGCALVSVIYWFMSFSQILTSDKMLYIFGSVSPKTSLMMSMTLRYVPLFTSRAKSVTQAQRALGLYSDEDRAQSLKGNARVFSSVVTWALENGIITADSMSARGYGTGRRTSFALFKFRKTDIYLVFIYSVLFILSIIGMASGETAFWFYPDISDVSLSPLAVLSYSAYLLLAALPTLIDTGEKLRWKYLESKI